ncbi:MAG: hypothetical protein DRJ03_16540 [Chloroflexi bacterium]|nr:MAG: hypothetical protein DRI81_08505 [Chloroflexota bacterium]RLC83647.1 MAG: hypothetical protein DRJ03_16540 [Chloroflexota bacterium]
MGVGVGVGVGIGVAVEVGVGVAVARNGGGVRSTGKSQASAAPISVSSTQGISFSRRIAVLSPGEQICQRVR